jgi:predicted XRE-type DNA-binding protein
MRKKLREIEQRDIDRFWSKVNKLGADECWLWKESVDKDGYGRFSFHSGSIPANRAALYFEKGGEYDGMLCMHSCDNPPCCNPAHLSWGTAEENSKDMVSKGRHSMHIVNIHKKYPERTMRGESHVFAKLSDLEVSEILEIWKTKKYSQKDIAAKFNIATSYVSELVNNKKRARDGECDKGEYGVKIKISKEAIVEMLFLHKAGETQAAIARKFNINPCTVSRFVNSKRRKAILQNIINQ